MRAEMNENGENAVDLLEKELEKRRPDTYVITELCKKNNQVPPSLRALVYQELLGVGKLQNVNLDKNILLVEGDLDNQKVIRSDADRTRADLALFKKPETKELITNLLTYYCKCRSIQYKQGMNEVLAPLVLLQMDTTLTEGVIFQCFYALINKFLPNVFADREFRSLQCSFRLFRLLILYHDPTLCHFLDQHDMLPELYAIPWFMTLFARGMPSEILFPLWDFIILNDDPLVVHFIAFSLLSSHRERLLVTEVAHLPQGLTSIKFTSVEHVKSITTDALNLMLSTPRSFCRDLYSACYCPISDSSIPVFRHLESSSCLGVYANEIVSHLLKRVSGAEEGDDKSFPYLLLDCRSASDFNNCHLSLSYHLDPELITSPEALHLLMDGFSRMKGCHFCFFGYNNSSNKLCAEKKDGRFKTLVKSSSAKMSRKKCSSNHSTYGNDCDSDICQIGYEEDLSVTRFVLMFLQKGFQHVSKLEGGFVSLTKEIDLLSTISQDQLLLRDGSSLIDDCSNNSLKVKAKQVATDFLGRIRGSSATNTTDTNVTFSSEQDVEEDAVVITTIKNEKGNVAVDKEEKQHPSSINPNVKGRMKSIKSAAKSAVFRQTSRLRLKSWNEKELEDDWLCVMSLTEEALRNKQNQQKKLKTVVLTDKVLGILFKSGSSNSTVVVDSVVPGGAGAESNLIDRGDILLAVNGIEITGNGFNDTMVLIQQADRPISLVFEIPLERYFTSIDALASSPTPPVLVAKQPDGPLSIMWDKVSGATRYQLQYTQHDHHRFHPWQTINLKNRTKYLQGADTKGENLITSGTIYGLPGCLSFQFRIRCGTDDAWGSYSLASDLMTTLGGRTDITSQEVQFVLGECPEVRETGVFYYRVVNGLYARALPKFSAPKLQEIILEKNAIIKGCERLMQPGVSQTFVRLDGMNAWVFENTLDGAIILERLPNDTIIEKPEAMSNSRRVTNLLFNNVNDENLPPPPTVQNCDSSHSLLVTFLIDDQHNEMTHAQIQYAKNSRTAMWSTWKEMIPVQLGKCILSHLDANTSYVVRLRIGKLNTETQQEVWTSFSKSSISVKTSAEESVTQQQQPSLKNSFFKRASSLIGNTYSKKESQKAEKVLYNRQNSIFTTSGTHIFKAEHVLPHIEDRNLDKNEQVELVITPDFFMVVKPTKGTSNYVDLITKKSISSLLKITSKRSISHLIVFHFQNQDDDVSDNQIHQLQFIVDNMKECLIAVKKYYKQKKLLGNNCA